LIEVRGNQCTTSTPCECDHCCECGILLVFAPRWTSRFADCAELFRKLWCSNLKFVLSVNHDLFLRNLDRFQFALLRCLNQRLAKQHTLCFVHAKVNREYLSDTPVRHRTANQHCASFNFILSFQLAL